ncbi:ribosome biogenesis factor YjgA [Sinimarinibacterium flocculans]|uniref:ribosome biogenesis factor YjgA n=1 Tax=Sinimarinibacterium flocculans TaxID=985250 RepID=UPI0024913482|nr:ribosome biogenesis factor YjgA [Sinimarinibacterium flocculans]
MRRRPSSEEIAAGTLPPSKSQLKREDQALHELGAALLELPAALLDAIPMSDRLREAFNDYRRFPTMEARRRQMQYIGKLLRSENADPLQLALDAHRSQRARDASVLHDAEQWRDRILDGDDGWQAWIAAFPAGDTRALRGLVTNARREKQQADDLARRGQPVRKGKLYRELFQKLRAVMSADDAASD